MPLKHGQETWLVFFLGIAMVAAGITAATLPPLPAGAMQWGGAFLLSFLYSLLLHPMLREHRADYAFRLLHWVPMWILLLWLVLQLIGLFVADLEFVVRWMTWGWALPLVTLGFFLLFVFCVRVLRRRRFRVTLLALLFLPFAVLAILSEQPDINFNHRIVAAVWDAPLWNVLQQTSETERDQRQIARDEDQEPQAVAGVFGSDTTSAGLLPSTLPTALQPGGTGAHIRDVASRPNGLPQAGFGWGAISLLLLAGYCGTLHARMRCSATVS